MRLAEQGLGERPFVLLSRAGIIKDGLGQGEGVIRTMTISSLVWGCKGFDSYGEKFKCAHMVGSVHRL